MSSYFGLVEYKSFQNKLKSAFTDDSQPFMSVGQGGALSKLNLKTSQLVEGGSHGDKPSLHCDDAHLNVKSPRVLCDIMP